jgi:threonine/homoserine/homoserine lactone efflux protein
LIAALGLTAVSVFSMQHQAAIRLAGAVLIILIGLYQFLLTYRAGAPDRDHQAPGVAKGFALVFTSTLSNPFTVCFFLSVFSAFSGTGAAAHTYRRAFAYAGGVGVGTAAWWLILTVCTGLFSRMLSAPVLAVIRKLAALLIVGIGIYALVR